MELLFELRDYADVTHNKFRYKFDSDDTLERLENVICSQFIIPKEKQILCLEGGEELCGISEDSLQALGLQNRCKVIVKHTMMPNWQSFESFFEIARKSAELQEIRQIEEAVDQALKHLLPLMKADFLVTYPRFNPTYCRFKEDFSRYVDQTFKYIKIACQDYFSKVYSDSPECPALDINCEQKAPEESGVQGGLICRVSHSQTLLGKYYVKEHMGLQNWQHADLREIYAYKFLELIGMGPEVHFIPNLHYSRFALYIGTAEVRGFRRADSEGTIITEEVYAQRDLLRRLLFIKDIHSKNFGLDGNGRLSIVDLQINSSINPQAIHKYFDNVHSWKGTRDLRIKEAKNCVKMWNLPENFDIANLAISRQKEFFHKHSIDYKPSRNFQNYLDEIKNNYIALNERLQ